MTTQDTFEALKYRIETDSRGTRYYNNAAGELHRIDGPAYEFADGSESWFLNGIRHRIDGPAIECADGTKAWFVNGKRHRLDGPAVEYAGGDKAWYIDGEYYTEDEFKALVKK